MKRISLILSLGFIVLSCSTTHKSKASHSSDVSMRQAGKIYELSVRDFKEIPKDLLENLDKMGADTSSILNEYEGRYLNFIFKVDQDEFDLVGKKLGFTRGKVAYFNETRERFSNNSSTVGGSSLYVFDANQKEESGGYDAFISMWSKFLLPTEEILRRLKK